MCHAKTVRDAATALQAAVEANHFGVMQVHNLKETMNKKGVAFVHECLIFEVCQPQQAKTVFDENMSVSTALPCRISIYEEDVKIVPEGFVASGVGDLLQPVGGVVAVIVGDIDLAAGV